jgi:glycosyltransferase involved in cell wall biosynthesis
VGRRIPAHDVDGWVSRSGLGGRVTLLPDVSDEDFLAWMCAADVAVDLRYPHRGEVSGSLARAMQCGRATIVSGTGTYLDIPEDLVVHVTAGRVDSGELAAAIGRLLDDPAAREAMGERAAERMRVIAREDRTAHVYAEAVEGTLALLADPSRRALARWAGALTDVGVTEDHLARGYGVSYARALDEFSGPSPSI